MAKGRRRADETLILALACGATIEKAAQQADVSETTVYRRLKEQAFSHRLQEARADMVRRASSMLTASAMESVKTLLDLQKPAQPPAVRLGAARSVLEIGIKLRQLVELEQEMAELQEVMVTFQGNLDALNR